MEEIKDEGQKESIDDILSDLNNLLNRMPAILEGIKLPNIGPIDFLSPRMPEPAVPDAAAGLSTESAPGQAEGAAWPSAPESPKLPEPEAEDEAEDVFDTAATPEARPEPEAAVTEEPHEPAPPSLAEHMFAQNARPEPPVPAATPVLIPESEPAPVPEQVFSPAPECGKFPDPEDVTGEQNSFSAATQPEGPVEQDVVNAEEPHEPAPPSLEEHMFAQNAQPEPAPVIMPECGPEPAPEPEVVTGEENSFYQAARPEERGEQGTVNPEEPHEPAPPSLEEHMFAQNVLPEPAGLNLPPEPPEIKPEPLRGEAAADPGQVSEVKKKPVYDLEAVKEEAAAIEKAFQRAPEKEEDEKVAPLFESTHDFGVPDIDTLIRLSQNKTAPAVGSDVFGEMSEEQAGPSPLIEPADDAQLQPEPILKPSAFTEAVPESQSALEADLDEIMIAPRGGSTDGEGEVMDIQNENPGKFEPEKPDRPAPEVADAAAPRLELATPQSFTLRSNEPTPEEPGFVLKQTNLEMNPNPPADDSGGDTASVAAVEERTGIFTPGAASRTRDEISPIADKPVPDGIPPERVRTVAFLYAVEDTDLCADVLTELDAICLKSASKPMFIKRGFVQAFNPEVNGNAYLQKVSEAGAMGLICLGNIPKDCVYDMENIFNAGVTFFRHFSREAFTRSAVLDLISELMLK